jgi:putative membrane protein
MIRHLALASGCLVLAVAWLGPLQAVAPNSFSGHMTLHVAVVAMAAPLIAVGVAGSRLDPTSRYPGLFAPIPASFLELVVVWSWHAPALHRVARESSAAFVVEQGSFLIAGLLVWLSAFGSPHQGRNRAMAGVVALLFTSMHMTLLGALLGLAGRPLFHYTSGCLTGLCLTPVEDQQGGGALMLAVGGAVYLAGGLVLAARLLRPERPPASVPATGRQRP